MRFYESEITLRRVNRGRYNGYQTHAKVETLIFDKCSVETPYVYSPLIDDLAGRVLVKVRSVEATGLPGEKRLERCFSQGEVITFVVRYLPYMNVTDPSSKRGHRRVFIQDKIDREVKLVSACERSGMNVISTEELEIKSTRFAKKEGRDFVLTDVTFLVNAEITDPTEFESVFISGLGAKANFGYGMMMVCEDAS